MINHKSMDRKKNEGKIIILVLSANDSKIYEICCFP